MSFFEKLFGSFSDKELKRINPLKDKVLALEPEMAKLTDEQLQAKTAEFKERLAKGVPVVRCMPNINAKVKASVTAICGGKGATADDIKIADGIFASVGKIYHIEEKMFPAFGALGGASGAFVLLYIDALAEAGVRAGFSRPMAEEIATATVMGSGALAMDSDEHPIALMNRVCSPGGTTVEGVCKLKELGFETAVQQALQAIIDKDIFLEAN